MMLKLYDKMDEQKKKYLIEKAEKFFKTLGKNTDEIKKLYTEEEKDEYLEDCLDDSYIEGTVNSKEVVIDIVWSTPKDSVIMA